MTPIGNMRERVTLQRPLSADETTDEQGGYEQAWEDVATVYAQVSPYKGREREAAAQIEALSPYRVQIWMRPDVTSDMRLLWRGKNLNIRSIYNADERRKMLTIDCEEGPAS